jgi:phage-related protein
MEERKYTVKFYKNSKSGKEPALEYIEKLDAKSKAKVLKYIDYLLQNNGYLDEPYSKHIRGKIRELRIDSSGSRHRIFYYTFINRTIILLSAFMKKTAKTPEREIEKALKHYIDSINNPSIYE